MLNLDMVGMNAPDSLLLIAEARHRELEDVARAQNGGSGFTLVSTGLEVGRERSYELHEARCTGPVLPFRAAPVLP